MVVGTQENGDIVLHVDVDLGADRPVAFDFKYSFSEVALLSD